MTLEQAYEKLRKEVLALRRENTKLKEGTYVDADRLANEKEIRRLTRENEKLTRDRERFHDLWQHALKQRDMRLEDFMRISDLEEENESLRSALASVQAQLQESQDLVAKLKAQMNRDHENSSISSSQKPFHKKIKNSREKTDRKPGGHKGHPGHKRPQMEPTTPVIFLDPTPEMLEDPDLYPTDEFISKQRADIKISVSVTEYRAQVYRSRTTGKRVHAPFPEGVTNEFNYGGNVKALAFLLNSYCNVSIDKTSEIINGLTGGSLSLSKGFINSLPSQFSVATKKDREKIFSALLLAPSMHVDFTPGRVNGKSIQVLVCGNPEEVLFSFRHQKGHKGIKDSPAEEYQQILIHDHDSTFYSYGADHQECLAHILRYLKDAMENEPDLTWHKKMHEFFSRVIHEAKQDRHFSDEAISLIENEYDSIVAEAEKEYKEHPPRKYFPDGFNLYKRMVKYKHNHLLFLRHPEIDYTNNPAERALRKFKRKLHRAVTFRCDDSVDTLCDCMSIIETNRLRGQDIFHSSFDAFSC